MLDGVVVLVVDDNVDSTAVLQIILESHGASVLSASSGAQALSIINQTSPDVLLSDIGMPGMDGYELIEQVRSRERQNRAANLADVHLPAAAISAFTRREDRRKAFLSGFSFHIPKPIDVDVLLNTVAQLVGRNVRTAQRGH